MIIKEKYIKSVKLNKLSGTIVFFANKNFEIKNIARLLNASENSLIKKNLKNNKKKKKFFLSIKAITKKLLFIPQKIARITMKKVGQNFMNFLKKII